MKSIFNSVFFLPAIFLVACGGGGGSGNAVTPPSTTPPASKNATIDDLLGVWDATSLINGNTDVVFYVFDRNYAYSYDYMNDSYDKQLGGTNGGKDCYEFYLATIIDNGGGNFTIDGDKGSIKITGTRADISANMMDVGVMYKSSRSTSSFTPLCK